MQTSEDNLENNDDQKNMIDRFRTLLAHVCTSSCIYERTSRLDKKLRRN